jgi:hypothetical protein
MQYHTEKQRAVLLPYEDLVLCCDYSEEAIPERDPAYRLPDGTECGEPTVEAVSAEMRLDLARRLQELGMSTSRAAFVASL